MKRFLNWFNGKVKKFSWVEIKVIGWIGVAFGLIFAKIQCIADISIWWWVVLVVLLYAWLVRAIFFRK